MRPIVRDRILEKCNHKCCHCGTKEKLQVDHIIPLSRGGRHDEENMQILCQLCNLKKGKGIDYDKYFKKGNREFMYLRRDFPLNSLSAKEFKALCEHKWKELCDGFED